MKNINDEFARLGIHIPEILIPRDRTSMAEWSIVACDQFTSQPEYWERVEKLVGGKPSTFRLILPEAYLENNDVRKRISEINLTMKQYVFNNIFEKLEPGFIFVDRSTPETPSRQGLVAALDLEMYDYRKGSGSMIRATEDTVIDRLPPRIRIREKAMLESPHILVFIDDPKKELIEPLACKTDKMTQLYDFDLIMGGGHITGYHVSDIALFEQIAASLNKLANKEGYIDKYCVNEDCPLLLYAVGDGNHSLASAKACWENLKSRLTRVQRQSHPAKYALVELVNIHNEGIRFEPIHRVLYNVNISSLLDAAKAYFGPHSKLEIRYGQSKNKTEICHPESVNSDIEPEKSNTGRHIINFAHKDGSGSFIIKQPLHQLEAGTLQAYLDEYLKHHTDVRIDYIHGTETALSLGRGNNAIAFLLPAIDKNSLFKAVIKEGVLPRKTFSIGEAHEKRYYLECRRIVL